MQELVEYIVGRLVVDDGNYSVSLSSSYNTVDITIVCEKKAIGKIIGKQGKIARSIRAIVKAAGARESGKRYNVTIVEAESAGE
ncbi:MAG: KH domain-containing protein [Clostridiaceae bacterium]|jgi:predicted RNA-binding protein YlqC (UPF0109 family)|nr:KH domain-containing protein [Clostridiaceae bacterium]